MTTVKKILIRRQKSNTPAPENHYLVKMNKKTHAQSRLQWRITNNLVEAIHIHNRPILA